MSKVKGQGNSRPLAKAFHVDTAASKSIFLLLAMLIRTIIFSVARFLNVTVVYCPV